MRYRLAIGCIALFLLTFFSRSGYLHASGKAILEVTEVQKDVTVAGVKGVSIKSKATITPQLPHDTTGIAKAIPAYQIHLFLTNQKGEQVQAGPGASNHSDRRGYFHSKAIIPGRTSPLANHVSSLFIPYYALDLPSGPHTLNYHLVTTNPRGDTLHTPIKGTLEITRPPAKLFRITMETLTVSPIASNGEPWDLQIFSPKEKKPELFWRLKREKTQLFRTQKQKNTLTYIGNRRKDRSPWFILCEGDQVWIEAMDLDITSFWDQIGRLEFDPWKEKEHTLEKSFESVTKAKFTLDSREAPKITITDLRSSVQAHEDGVSGFSIRFAYQAPNRSPQNRYFIDLDQFCDTGDSPIEHTKLVTGPVAPEDGRFELLSKKGEVKLFLPYYALCNSGSQSPPVRLQIHGNLDGNEYLLYNQALDIKRNAFDLDDLEFGQFKFGQEVNRGQSGIMLSCDYRLPEDYIRDHPEAIFQINADLRADHRSITVQKTQIADRLAPEQAMYVRNINGRNPKGTLLLFIPYTRLKPGKRATTCGVELECVMLEGETIRTLGTYSVEQELNLPDLQGLSIRVKEASVKKSALGKEIPNLRWLLWVGQEVVYVSPVQRGDHTPEWGEYSMAKTSVIDTDQLRISLVQDQENGQFIELGTWSGKLDLLPAEGEEEKVSLDGGVKMVIVRETYY